MDWKKALGKIYEPEIGSIWKAPNKIWTTNFAKNQNPEGLHPAIVERATRDGVSVKIVPGTTKDYQMGSCVYKVKLKDEDIDSHFLLKKTMPFVIDDLIVLDRGWNGQVSLKEEQVKDFQWQIIVCKG